ncbi:MAG: GNAT family N-acetyltransferase [Chloroflexi bacterium]|nr:GNAT family N-acetyltransferase [Chloroflexota bacterium]
MRDARREDLPRIVALYRTDELTRKHKGAADAEVEPGYYAVFDAIERDHRNRLLVAEAGGVIAGSFQLTLVPDMQPDGRDVAIVENVIVDAAARGRGIGSAMMRWAVDEARRHGCSQVKLTSSRTRVGAHRFYERLGFEPTHVGFKILL